MSRREKADGEFQTEKPGADLKEERSEKGLRNYWVTTNMESLDGLPGILSAPFAKPVPQSDWTLDKEGERGKAADIQFGVKGETRSHLSGDTRLLTAFSLGVLVAAVSFRIGSYFSEA